MVFRNRRDAGERLAEALAPALHPPCVVAAIPRGGVSVAMPIVERFRLPLAVAYARKLTAPIAPEFAFGAMDEDGRATVDAGSVARLGLDAHDVEQAKAVVLQEIRRRVATYGVEPLGPRVGGAAVLLVDDGLATGLTMRAALAYVRRHGAREVIVAVPCAAAAAAEEFRGLADSFVCPLVDPGFMAVGQYYLDFEPVSDAEVIAMLAVAPSHAERPLGGGLRVTFKNDRGLALVGRLLVPGRHPGPHPVVVVAHGWGSSKDSPRSLAVADALGAMGIAAFLFDFTGHGDSEGTEADSTLEQQTDDLRSALDAVQGLDELSSDRMGVAAASSGAAAALRAAARDPRIRALALRSPNPAGAEEAVSSVTVPTLFVIGEHDVPSIGACESLLPRLGGPWKLEVVSGGDHLFGDPVALTRAAALIAEWLHRHLRAV